MILAVTTGVYDGLGELFGNFTVYYTTKGNALLDEDVRLVNGNIVSSVDYIDYYKNVDEVLNEVSENMSQDGEGDAGDNAVHEADNIESEANIENNEYCDEEVQ